MKDSKVIWVLVVFLVTLAVVALCLDTSFPVETPDAEEASSFEANVSAYCPCEKCCGRWATEGVNSKGQRITASGHVIQPDDKFVAAPAKYPFGTIIDIPGYGKVPVLDRGGAIVGNKFDVLFHTHQEALEWGRQYLTVRRK